ncbi:hypothetical protein QBC44DRAFT_402150 [Cladorrhinum sp. PSN332]|nr:hypothetical protein QBC44DRAFT_402150 [Cladorrhinum sp. PSN332]
MSASNNNNTNNTNNTNKNRNHQKGKKKAKGNGGNPKPRPSVFMFPDLHERVAAALADVNIAPPYEFHTNGRDYSSIQNYKTHGQQKGTITIRQYHGHAYNAAVFNQKCKGCEQLGVLELDEECYIDRVAYRIKVWERIPVEERPFGSGEGPEHETFLEVGFRTIPVSEGQRAVPTNKDGGPASLREPYVYISKPLRLAKAMETPIPQANDNKSALEPSSTPTLPLPASEPPDLTEWDGLPTGIISSGGRDGYPWIGLHDHGAFNSSSPYLNLSSLARRVSPRDQYGYFPDAAIAVELGIAATLRLDFDCSVVCDGPALVFLKPRCWELWSGHAEHEESVTLENPGVKLIYIETAEDQVRPCDPPAPKIPRIETITATLYEQVSPTPVTRAGLTQDTAIIMVPITITPVPSTMTDEGGTPIRTTLTLTDDNGRPTTTAVDVVVSWIDQTVTLRDAKRIPTATRTYYAFGPAPTAVGHAVLTISGVHSQIIWTTQILSDGNGRAIHTEYAYPVGHWSDQTVVLRDQNGLATATKIYSMETILKTYADLYNPGRQDTVNGRPTATVTATITESQVIRTKEGIDRHGRPTTITNIGRICQTQPDGQIPGFRPLSWGDYFHAAFIPVIIALPLGILTQVINSYIKVLVPYCGLAREPHGATAEDSLRVRTGELYDYLTGFRLLFRHREPTFLVSQTLLLLSAVTVSISTEAFGIKLHGVCIADSFSGCHMGIAVYRTPG